jgi:hypothetical protein
MRRRARGHKSFVVDSFVDLLVKRRVSSGTTRPGPLRARRVHRTTAGDVPNERRFPCALRNATSADDASRVFAVSWMRVSPVLPLLAPSATQSAPCLRPVVPRAALPLPGRPASALFGRRTRLSRDERVVRPASAFFGRRGCRLAPPLRSAVPRVRLGESGALRPRARRRRSVVPGADPS